MKELEWLQHYSLIILTLKAANTAVSDGILSKIFKLVQAFMADLVTCKNKEDPSKNEGTRMDTTFLTL